MSDKVVDKVLVIDDREELAYMNIQDIYENDKQEYLIMRKGIGFGKKTAERIEIDSEAYGNHFYLRHPRSGRSDDAGRQNRGAGRRSRGAGWETAGAVPLSGRPFCRRIYRFAKDELPAGKSDRHRNRSSAGGAADAKSSASLAAS